MVLVCKEFLKLLVEWCWLWGRRAGHPNKRGQNGPPKCGSNSGIISIYLNHSEENWLAYENQHLFQSFMYSSLPGTRNRDVPGTSRSTNILPVTVIVNFCCSVAKSCLPL